MYIFKFRVLCVLMALSHFKRAGVKMTGYKDTYLVNLLRVAAIAGVCLAGLGKVLARGPLEQNQYFSFIVLGLIAGAVCIVLFAFLPGTTFRILKNPDILVPIGLYVAAHEAITGLLGSAAFILFNGGKFFYEGLTGAILLSWILQVGIAVCFLGWMTRILLRFSEDGRVDLIGAFKNTGYWFPRTLGVISLNLIPLLLSAALFLPMFLSGNTQDFIAFLYVWIVLVAVMALFWNLATAAVLPYVLSTETNLWTSIREGIRLSWSDKRKIFLPVVALMLVSGWIVYFAFSYTETKDSESEAAFGETSSTTTHSVTQHTKWNLSSNFKWVVSYPEKSEWNAKVMESIKQTPLASVDLRIMLLLLLLSAAVNMRIIEKIWPKDEFAGETERFDDNPNAGPGIAVFATMLVLLIPFEYMGVPERRPGAPTAADEAAVELIVPKIYTGEGAFSRTEIFRYEKTEEEKKGPFIVGTSTESTGSGSGTGGGTGTGTGTGTGQGTGSADRPKKYEPDRDQFELNDIEQIYAGEVDDEPGTDILAAGRTNAFVLTPEGRVKKKIAYNLGKSWDIVEQDRDLAFIRIEDLDGDGKPEIAGHGAYACEILDLKGKTVWKYGPKGKESEVDALRIGDVDNDGKNEILVARDTDLEAYSENGRRKWSTDISDSIFGAIEIADVDGDGKNEIVAGKSILDGRGKHVKDIKKPYSVDGYLNQKGENFYFVFINGNRLGLFSDDKLKANYDAPLSDIQKIRKPDDNNFLTGMSVFGADALFVKFGADQQKYLAVLADADDSGGYDYFRILYIYDSERKLVYHETIRTYNGEMTILPKADGTESLLVVDDGKIIRYSLN